MVIATPHALAGAAAGQRVAFGGRAVAVAVAFTAGVLTHLLLDRVPHADYALAEFGGLLFVVDFAVAAALSVKLTGGPLVPLTGAAGGVLPDVAHVLEKHAGIDITRTLQVANHTDLTWPLWAGLATQAAVVGLCVLLLCGRR